MSVEQHTAEQKREAHERKREAQVRADKTDKLRGARYVSVSVLSKGDSLPQVAPSASLAETVACIRENESNCAVVCDGNQVVGLFTEHDVFTKVIGEGIDQSLPVRDWMQSPVKTLTAAATLSDAVSLMNEKDCYSIPIVEDNQLVGLLSVADVVTYLAESYPKETINLPPVPAQVMDTQEGG